MRGLDIEEDVAAERREYRIRLVAAGFGMLVLAAALLGVFGGGPLADARAASDDGELVVEYERFARFEASSDLTVTLPAAVDGDAEVAITADYLQGFEVTAVTPEPSSTELTPDRLVYTFEVARAPADVTFSLTPQRFGPQHATVFGPGGRMVSFDQLVYP